jgi:protease-4
MKRVVQFLFIALILIFISGMLMGIGGLMALFNPGEERVEKASILALDLNGVILDGHEFLDALRKYRKESRIKGVLIRINSPGGVVGPSQEMYDEIKRTREEFKKPVYAYCSAVAASGAYYAAVGAEKIYTTPGCMIGSIGALMEFVDMEKLYDWAKVKRYAITTGKFKDAGAEYKALTPEQHDLFQALLMDVLDQFKGAIREGRKMKPEFLDQYADGRVFTGRQAVKLGFADKMGTWDDARQALGQEVGLGPNPEVFHAKKRRGMMDFFEDASGANEESKFSHIAQDLFKTELNGRPLFVLPGAVGL